MSGSPITDQTAATGCRILAVDDEKDVRRLTEYEIRDLGPVVIVFGLPVISTAWLFGFRPWAAGHLPLSGGRQWTIN